MKKCLKCNVDLPNIIVIDGKRHNICNRKFCLDCSPFKQHNTKNLNLYEIIQTKKICPSCNIEKSIDEFYRRRNDTNCSTYCKNCTTIETTKRQRTVKQKAVNYLGGKCSICNYDKYTGALEFHHINPAEKDFNIAELKLSSFERIKPELDKCLLVCSNCHREIHGKIIEIPPRN
jgi:predicted HNH restriction endonuclease